MLPQAGNELRQPERLALLDHAAPIQSRGPTGRTGQARRKALVVRTAGDDIGPARGVAAGVIAVSSGATGRAPAQHGLVRIVLDPFFREAVGRRGEGCGERAEVGQGGGHVEAYILIQRPGRPWRRQVKGGEPRKY